MSGITTSKSKIPPVPQYLLEPLSVTFANKKGLKYRGETVVFKSIPKIKKAYMTAIKQEYPFFGFTTWENSQINDTAFRDKLIDILVRTSKSNEIDIIR